jgi:hypothetical protein
MKAACILFHSNIFGIYQKEWVEKCINSIVNQTYQNFDIYELNYGDEDSCLKEIFNIQKQHYFVKKKMDNHAQAMNYLLDLIFKEKDYDICFNINLDDFYDLTRFEKQIEVIKKGYDVVSSDYVFTRSNNDNYQFSGPLGLGSQTLETLFRKDITPLAHPCVCYSKNFWVKYGPYIPEEIPREDKNLWIRSYEKGAKMFIIDEPLLYYRIHQKQVSSGV